MCIPHAGTPVNSAFNRRIEVRKRELDLPQDKLHDLQTNLRKISHRRKPNLVAKEFYLQCRKHYADHGMIITPRNSNKKRYISRIRK